MDSQEFANRGRAKLQASLRAMREGGKASDYFEEELAKLKAEGYGQRLEELGEKRRAALKKVFVGDTASDEIDLEGLNREQLKTLHRQTVIEIEDLENRLAGMKESGNKTATQLNDSQSPAGIIVGLLSGGLNNFGMVRNTLVAKKKLLAAIEVRLEGLQPALTPMQAEIAEMQEVLQERDELKARSPKELHPDIDRVYGQKMDEIRRRKR